MVGTVLALMIADIKRVSQLFQDLKSTDMLEIYPLVLKDLCQETSVYLGMEHTQYLIWRTDR